MSNSSPTENLINSIVCMAVTNVEGRQGDELTHTCVRITKVGHEVDRA